MRKQKSLGKRIFESRYVYLGLLPCLGIIMLFMVYPLFEAITMSFTNWNMSNYNNPKFVGIDNYIKVLSDAVFWKSMGNLFFFILWGFITTVCWMVPITYLIYKLGTGKLGRIFQRAYVIPMMVPTMVITLYWKFFYEPNFGMLNGVLKTLGASDKLSSWVWLGEKLTALPALLFMGFPWVSGFGFLIILAGFQSVDKSYQEAASIDGASPFKVFIKIDIPLIIPQLKMLIMLGMISGIQQYSNQMIMTKGGPSYATYVPGLLMYNTAFSYKKLGQGSAIGVILFIMILLFTIISNAKIKKADE